MVNVACHLGGAYSHGNMSGPVYEGVSIRLAEVGRPVLNVSSQHVGKDPGWKANKKPRKDEQQHPSISLPPHRGCHVPSHLKLLPRNFLAMMVLNCEPEQTITCLRNFVTVTGRAASFRHSAAGSSLRFHGSRITESSPTLSRVGSASGDRIASSCTSQASWHQTAP